jgi:hypothetical protein
MCGYSIIRSISSLGNYLHTYNSEKVPPEAKKLNLGEIRGKNRDQRERATRI